MSNRVTSRTPLQGPTEASDGNDSVALEGRCPRSTDGAAAPGRTATQPLKGASPAREDVARQADEFALLCDAITPLLEEYQRQNA